MAMEFGSRFKRAWNVFVGNEELEFKMPSPGTPTYLRPDRPHFSRINERTIVASIINKFANDAAAVDIRHAQLDEKGRFKETINSKFNRCLNLEANLDQASRSFLLDIYQSLLDEGCIAIVPIETYGDPNISDSYEIYSMRVGKIVEWKPYRVKVSLYDERDGRNKEVWVDKRTAAIVENPFYSVMNEPNSTLKRLTRKLSILDAIDEQSGSGKLDLIIQLPYVVKTTARKRQAEQRRKDIEEQLSGSKYGIAYTDGTEHITQLNRSVENNLMSQIEYLTSMLFSQLGITQGVLDGSASTEVMTNYQQRIIERLVAAVAGEMKRKFLTKTAITQGQSVMYFIDPFKLIPANQLAEMSDKLTRNEIMSTNEIRGKIGLNPSDDPKADELRNKNLNAGNDQEFAKAP